MTLNSYEIDMSTLDCPFGCGSKLIQDEYGYANCPTYSWGSGQECEGASALFTDADDVVNTARDNMRYHLQSLDNAKRTVSDWTHIVRQEEDRADKAIRLLNRIAKQHG